MLSIVLISRNCGLIKVLNLDSTSHFHRNDPFIQTRANNERTSQLYSRGACNGHPVPRFLPNPDPSLWFSPSIVQAGLYPKRMSLERPNLRLDN
ncbi:hypothetical protein TNIN_128291 [Trichonephila inaurata madagascariensis]|uniref:Uncharacterized protein n=1 Tax=Trichonephila inaurata madagascariensis TaxID=2747483 RepID=A0A8X6XE96_9ARAC|nr:hypothetical protein TNIN_128291 [Trichonephila inaurata madagascariensis]